MQKKIIDIINGAQVSIQEEFSKAANPWINCFASVTDILDSYQYFVQGYIDEEKIKKIDEKIERLKTEVWELRQKYTTDKNKQPTNKEKKDLFEKLAEIKRMIE